jgi:DNA-binding SARP family transcriptional activator
LPDGIDGRRSARAAARGTDAPSPIVAAKVRVPPAAALQRERLQSLLDAIWERRLGVVVAPAGSGKTTLLADFAARAGVPVAWYRAESWDADEASMVRHLEAAVQSALPEVPGGWGTVEDAAAALESRSFERALLVVDDAHGLEGTPAEAALGRFVEYAPRWLAIVIGSRLPPSINVSRLRVAGDLLEIGPDELRFRAWEVERLFRDHYGEPVPPDELAVLARRTEGWAAGLQLFHLATRGKSADERRRILAAVGAGSRLIREYLTWNVMADLPEELRDFLVETCVLGRLTGPLCDRLLDRRGSAALLAELYRRQIFTVELDEADESYRYHEVFRSLLDRMLVDRVGEEAARDRYARAGTLLEEAGAVAEALGAFSRAEDWTAVRRLLGGQGERLADSAPAWLESLPPAIIRHEPWLELASARRARAEGRWMDALDAFGRAEAGFGASSIALVCHRERQALRAWFEPAPPGPASDWSRIVRAGVVREPLGAARDAARQDGVPPSFLRGLLALAAGEVAVARRELTAARPGLEGDATLAAACMLARGVATVLAGDPSGAAEIDAAEDAADRAGAPWLGWLARAASRFSAEGAAPVEPAARSVLDPVRDPWGAAVAALIEAWEPGIDVGAAKRAGANGDAAASAAERRVAAAERASSEFRRLGAGVLEAWARGLLAIGLAESSAPEAREAAMSAESLARAAGAPGVRLLTYQSMRIADEGRRAEYEALEATVREETGLVGPPAAFRSVGASLESAVASANGARREAAAPEPKTAARATPRRDVAATNGHAASTNGHAAAGPVVRFRTLGGFAVTVAGQDLALDAIKPRARSLLRLLAVHAGSAVHREVIAVALWPEADAQVAGRSLQVAVSAVRGLFVEAIGADGGRLVVREGDAYRLGVEPEAVDLRRFDRAVGEARLVRAKGGDVATKLQDAMALYGGDMLPEEGPSEWVVEQREHYRAAAVEVSREAAEAAMLDGDPRAAVEACRVGLAIDRYHDPLWRLLIEARQAAGDVSAANRDRREYEAILSELGVPEVASTSS